MLRLIPPFVHRIAYRAAHRLRTLWWRLRRPTVVGCRVLAVDADRRLLLIRHSYGSRRWMLPGGGIGRGEDPLAAAARELAEETGCTLHDAREIALVEERLYGARNQVHVIAGRAAGAPAADRREVLEARFFAPGEMPDDMPARLRDGLSGWLSAPPPRG